MQLINDNTTNQDDWKKLAAQYNDFLSQEKKNCTSKQGDRTSCPHTFNIS